MVEMETHHVCTVHCVGCPLPDVPVRHLRRVVQPEARHGAAQEDAHWRGPVW